MASASWTEDPTGRYLGRYWDGSQYTPWVFNSDGEIVLDRGSPAPQGTGSGRASSTLSPASGSSSPNSGHGEDSASPNSSARPGNQNVTHDSGASTGRAATQPRSPQSPMARALGVLRTVTLQSWEDRRWAEAFGIQELMEQVQARPGDPVPLMWLGLRLQEMERTKQQNKEAISYVRSYVTVTGLVTRPLIRRAAQAVQDRSGAKPASTRVLSAAWKALHPLVNGKVAYPQHVCLMARNYLAGGRPDKAWETAASAANLRPPVGQAFYVLAEVLAENGDYQAAREWAAQAVDLGCTLGTALLHPEAEFRRSAWTGTARSSVPPSAKDFWKAKEQYYEKAASYELNDYYGSAPRGWCQDEGARRG